MRMEGALQKAALQKAALQKAARQNARSSYRVVYPELAQPRIRVITSSAPAAPVLDCSEGGLCFRAPVAWPRVAIGAVLRGKIEFRVSARTEFERTENCGITVEVTGRVVRVDGCLVAVRLDAPGVPFGVLLHEQYALRARYPNWPANKDRTAHAACDCNSD